MRTLVTGGGGFLGRYIVEKLLERGDSVRVLCRNDYPFLREKGAEICRVDLKNERQIADACEGIGTVFHAAGLPGISMFWRPFYETNTLGTKYLINACQKKGVKNFVYTSTASVVFDAVPIENGDESLPYPKKWLSHYPHSKALAENIVLKANGVDGLSTCSLRPHLIWGPKDRQLVPRLWERAKAQRLCRIGDGKNLVDIIYVENAADAHLQAADALSESGKNAGKAYFISQNNPVSCWDWINELLAIAKLPPVKKHISYDIAYEHGFYQEFFYQLCGWDSEPTMTRFLAGQLALSHYFDCCAAERDFGYKPKVSIEEGMRRLEQNVREA